MELRPGLKLNSAVSGAQIIVVRAPSGAVDLRCAGEPMVPEGTPLSATSTAGGDVLLIGKRYSDDTGSLELLCTKPGLGPLSVGEQVLSIKAAKPLPASD
ncbi:hypothetical protein [Nocardia cerradoensis]|uniref:Uncharacterized protein n=1 Tax=Nocardia cerradoensis TaxID=85688 RepID=A0A231GV59_9NOCA|nr:hypothetical protein [Nocardia cerradoensis]NKY43636.1 hypothetical protein [Nocardia cerradoensis]OXR40435.1 hypothetical protein B7C42_07493 [Nocardia cerradoensis]